MERGIAWALSIPAQVVSGLGLVFDTNLANLEAHLPNLHRLSAGLRLLLEACFWLGIGHALYHFARHWRKLFRELPEPERRIPQAWKIARDLIATTAAGRTLFLLLIILGTIAGLILVRAGPVQQPSYFAGLSGLQFLICAYTVTILNSRLRLQRLLLLLLLVLVALGALDRFVRVSQHDFSAHTPLNVNLYENINRAVTWIANDWQGPTSITLSYDMFPEMAQEWWVVAWHRVDGSYRIGMAYDFLLSSYHNLENRNRNPEGIAEDPNYIVTTAPGSKRYDVDLYDSRQFGAVYVLKPLAS